MDSANLNPTGKRKKSNANSHKTGIVKTDNPELTAKSFEGVSIQTNHWLKLDEDSLASVIGHLDLKSAWRLSGTCRFFRDTELMRLIPEGTRTIKLMRLIPESTPAIMNYSYTSRVAIILSPQILNSIPLKFPSSLAPSAHPWNFLDIMQKKLSHDELAAKMTTPKSLSADPKTQGKTTDPFCDEDKNDRITQLVGEAITKIDKTYAPQKQLFELMKNLMLLAENYNSHLQLPLSSSNPEFELFKRVEQKFDECNWEDIITKVTKESLNDSGCVWIDDNQSMLVLKNLVLADAPRLLALAQKTEKTHEEFEEWITACINEENFLDKTPIQKLAALVDSFIRHVVSASS